MVSSRSGVEPGARIFPPRACRFSTSNHPWAGWKADVALFESSTLGKSAAHGATSSSQRPWEGWRLLAHWTAEPAAVEGPAFVCWCRAPHALATLCSISQRCTGRVGLVGAGADAEPVQAEPSASPARLPPTPPSRACKPCSLLLRRADGELPPPWSLGRPPTSPLVTLGARGLCTGVVRDEASGLEVEMVCWVDGHGVVSCHVLWTWGDAWGTVNTDGRPLSRSLHGVARMQAASGSSAAILRIEPDLDGAAGQCLVEAGGGTSSATPQGGAHTTQVASAPAATAAVGESGARGDRGDTGDIVLLGNAVEELARPGGGSRLVVSATHVACLLPRLLHLRERRSSSEWQLLLLPASATAGCFVGSRAGTATVPFEPGEPSSLLLYIPAQSATSSPPLTGRPAVCSRMATESAGAAPAIGSLCAIPLARPSAPSHAIAVVPAAVVPAAGVGHSGTDAVSARDRESLGGSAGAAIDAAGGAAGGAAALHEVPEMGGAILLEDALDPDRFVLLSGGRRCGPRRGEHALWAGKLEPDGRPCLSAAVKLVVQWDLGRPPTPVASCAGLLLFHSDDGTGGHEWMGCSPSAGTFAPLNLPPSCASVRAACEALIQRFK